MAILAISPLNGHNDHCATSLSHCALSHISTMEEFLTPAMNVYLNGLAPTSKNAYIHKMEAFVEYCQSGTDTGPYETSIEDVSEYIISMHESGYKTSSLWTAMSMILTFFEIGKDVNVNAVKKLMARHLKQWEKDESTKKAKVYCKILI